MQEKVIQHSQPLLKCLRFTCFKSLCHPGRKYNISGELEGFISIFFQTCHLGRENNSLFCNSDRRQTAHGIAD